MLKIEDLKVNYGGIEAVKGITFDVAEGSIVTLIGANGAGKSTTLRMIAGLVQPRSGKISFMDEDITGLKPDKIVSRGITLVPEGRRVFSDLTVLENLKVGAYLRNDSLTDDINWVYELFPRLKERSRPAAGTLSGVSFWRSSSICAAVSMRMMDSGCNSVLPRRGSVLTWDSISSSTVDWPSPVTVIRSLRLAAISLPPMTSRRCSMP